MSVQLWMRRFARWHIWLGWAVALPILMWVITGLIMVARPIEEVRGEALRAPPGSIDPAGLEFPKLPEPIREAKLVRQPDGPVWIVTEQDGGQYRYSATEGTAIPPVIEAEARQIALASYAGTSELAQAKYFAPEEAPLDLRRPVASWQVRFADGTQIYIDDSTGEVLALRTGQWRFYDFLYGLHIMDPAAREDAHNAFSIVFAILALAGALLGSILLFRRRKARVKG